MAVCIKPQTTTEARFLGKVIFWRALDEFDTPAMGILLLPQHLGQG
jgi:hypothetical protein